MNGIRKRRLPPFQKLLRNNPTGHDRKRGGEIVHQGKAYPGEHKGIIAHHTFKKGQSLTSSNRVRRKHGAHAEHPSLPAGIIWDGQGRRMTPNHATMNGRRYRYYASQPDQERLELPIHRLPAGEIEKFVSSLLSHTTGASWDGPMPSREPVMQHIAKVTIHVDRIEILDLESEEPITVEASLIGCGNEARIDAPSQEWSEARRD